MTETKAGKVKVVFGLSLELGHLFSVRPETANKEWFCPSQRLQQLAQGGLSEKRALLWIYVSNRFQRHRTLSTHKPVHFRTFPGDTFDHLIKLKFISRGWFCPHQESSILKLPVTFWKLDVIQFKQFSFISYLTFWHLVVASEVLFKLLNPTIK